MRFFYLIRDLSRIFESSRGIDAAAATSRLNQLGWNGVILNYQSLHLVSEYISCKRMV
jgi:hypothetical protein